MTRRIESVEGDEFGRLFATFQHTAYRLETLQAYCGADEQEPLCRFLDGESRPFDPAKDAWTTMIRGAVAAGKRMQRVHVIHEPLSDYLRYELAWSYEPNVAAGEDIRVLAVTAGRWPEGLPEHDYWLFDSSDLWVMSYDDSGRFVRAELCEDPAEVVRHCYWRDAALHDAMGYAEYMQGQPELRARQAS